MLPLKTLLLPWPTLLIRQISFLLMILILSMFWRNICLWKIESTEDTAVWNTIKICYKKTRFYWSTCSDKNKKFYYCHGFPGLIQRQIIVSWEINIICQIFQLIVVFVSLTSFTLPVERVLCLFYSCSIDQNLVLLFMTVRYVMRHDALPIWFLSLIVVCHRHEDGQYSLAVWPGFHHMHSSSQQK